VAQVTTLPSWWQVMPPHHDIRTNKRLDESIFAADLDQVVREAAPFDYQDPLRFFASTYLTQGLQSLLSDVMRELAGSSVGNRIIQIETPFGGGKTHTLLALYHLIHNSAVVMQRPDVAALVRSVGLDTVPEARLATFVGTDPSVVNPQIQADGTTIHTLWGRIAYQLGGAEGYELMRQADEARVAPGADALRDMLTRGPAKLILMDELVNYVVAAAGVPIGMTTLKDQTISFLQQLTQAVAQTPRSVLLLTIPSSQTELYGQAAKDVQEQLFSAAGQVAEIVGRVQTVCTPVQGDDIYEVLRRRLLDQPSGEADRLERERKAQAVARAYVSMYQSLPHDVPPEVQEPAYIERMVRAYPFHPDVVRILYERWGTLPDFQRTRGVLRILGMVLADLFASNSHDPLILPGHFNLAPGDLRNELVRVLENPAFNNVIDSDIAGSDAKTVYIDNGMGREHARFNPARRTATAIFLWSFSGSMTEAGGATDAQIRVGVLTPDMQPAIIGNVLNEFGRRLWYLHEENNSYRFNTRANLNRVIVQKEEGVTAQIARKAVEDQVTDLVTEPRAKGNGAGLFGRAGAAVPNDARPYLYPKDSQDVADTPSIGIVMLRPSQHALAGTDLDGLAPLVKEIMLRYGERPRQNRNALVVLVPDTTLVAEAEKAARRLLALQAAAADTQLALPEQQRAELARLLHVATDAFPQEVGRIYRSVVIPAAQDRGGMERFDLGLRPFTRGSSLWDDAFSRLATEERYLTALAPSLVASNHFGIWPRATDYMSTQKLWDAFVQFPHLPMLSGKQVLATTIATGCDNSVLGYAIGTAEGPPFAPGRFDAHNPSLVIDIAPDTWVLTANDARQSIVPVSDPVQHVVPSVLAGPTIWPSSAGRRALTDVWAAMVAHYAPRPVDDSRVLADAVRDGVAQGLFKVSVDGHDPTDDAANLDIERLHALQGVELVRVGKEPGPPTKHMRFLTIDVKNIDPSQLSKIMTGSIMPLKQQGAMVTLRLVIDADAPNGIASEVLELTIKETFKQLGLSPDYEISG